MRASADRIPRRIDATLRGCVGAALVLMAALCAAPAFPQQPDAGTAREGTAAVTPAPAQTPAPAPAEADDGAGTQKQTQGTHNPDATTSQRELEQLERQRTQPGNNAPVWREVRSGREWTTQIQSIEAGSLINAGGQTWRAVRSALTFWGGLWLLAVPAVILVFYLVVGPLRSHALPTGRWIVRFAAIERAVHWTVAITFLCMAVTGFLIFFGKYYLVVLLTHPVWSVIAKLSLSIHNFIAPLFAVSLATLAATFYRRNFWRRADWAWLRAGGGLVSKREPPAGFFNAGEKLWYWLGVVVLGVVMVASGLVLLFPLWNQTRNVLAIADVIHLTGALAFAAMAMGHIYMGTIGMHGAWRAMRHGVVDETWAREHHALWYEDLRAGRAQPPAEPADARLDAALREGPGHAPR